MKIKRKGTENMNNERLALLINIRKTYKNDKQNTIFDIYNNYKDLNLKDNAYNFYNIILKDEEFIKMFCFDTYHALGYSLEEIKQEIKGC